MMGLLISSHSYIKEKKVNFKPLSPKVKKDQVKMKLRREKNSKKRRNKKRMREKKERRMDFPNELSIQRKKMKKKENEGQGDHENSPKDIPHGLPPIRGIEHQIDLIMVATLPNRAAYRANLEESKVRWGLGEQELVCCTCDLGTKEGWVLEDMYGLSSHKCNYN
ncbi:hypothetical protein CR513_00337, partial [Mucuna pruriens]